jgi:peptidoglycan hydrolase-like protein with peptidoglycan-binding domain
MQGSLPARILNNLSANKLSWLLLFSTTPLLIGSLPSLAAPQQIAQVTRPTLTLGSQGERVNELQAALKLLGFYSGAVDGIYSDNTAKAVSQFQQAAGLNPDGVVNSITWQRLFPSEPIVTGTISAPQPKPIVSSGFPVRTLPSNTTRIKPPNSKPVTVIRTRTTTTRIQPTPPNQQNPAIQYTSEGFPILRLGMRGAEVVKLQTQLQRLGFLKGGIDGDFGVTTETAVKALQTRYGITADGVVGGATWQALLR